MKKMSVIEYLRQYRKFAVPLLFLFFCLSLPAHSESKLKAPIISVDSFNLSSIDLNNTHLRLQLSVTNLNSKTLTVTAVDYTVTVNNAQISSSISQQETFYPNKKKVVIVPVSLPHSSTSAAVMEIISSEEKDIPYFISGEVTVLGEPAPIPFEHEGQVMFGD